MEHFLKGSFDPNNVPTPNLGIAFVVLVRRYRMLVPGLGTTHPCLLDRTWHKAQEVQVICTCDLCL